MLSILRWLSAILTALIVALGTTLYVEPAKNLISGSSVVVESYTFPWYPYGGIPDEPSAPSQDSDSYVPGDRRSFVSQQAEWGARLFINNNTSEEVKSIRIDFRDFTRLDGVVLGSNGEKDRPFKSAEYIDLPGLKSGDSATVFIWSGLKLSNYMDDIKIYTSVGRIRHQDITMAEENFDKGILRWIDKNGSVVLVLMVSLLAAFVWLVGYVNEKYYKHLLLNEVDYEDERTRFALEGDKFTPSTRILQTILK